MNIIRIYLVIIGLLIIFGLGCIQSGKVTPATQESCDQSLWNHVYNPSRLQINESCKTVTGFIEYIKKEPDGDDHIRLKLDPAYANLINQKNIEKQYGDLVLEPICKNPITQKDAILPCKGFHQNFSVSIGQHIKVTGAYVLDMQHGWMEIHPITSMAKIDNVTIEVTNTNDSTNDSNNFE